MMQEHSKGIKPPSQSQPTLCDESNNNDNGIKILPDITAAIGNTPMVDLSRLVKHHGVEGRILAKLEYLNPGFSKKDRIAKQIIIEAKESGELKPGQTVVELTSGNTGTGLAIVCAIHGHPFVAVMSEGNSIERARMMNALGAQVVLVPQGPESKPGQVSGKDLELVEIRTQQLVQEKNAFRADQFRRMGNARAHLLGTAPEMWHDSGESITAFCDFIGTGGSYGGCATYFKKRGVHCYIVEPKGAAILAGQQITSPSHKIQGGGYVMDHLEMLNGENKKDFSSIIDGYIQISDEEAIQMSRDLAKFEGIFGGFSGGANVAAALKLLQNKHHHPGGTIAILICDSGLKYLSTDLWGDITI